MDEADSDCAAVDNDGDGYTEDTDCDDSDPDLNHDDADNDGYSTCDGDCDDFDDDNHPNAAEVCDDNEDNDCDGDVDEADSDCAAVDNDGDGYDESEDCDDNDADLNLDDADNDGYSTCDGDCDDNDDDINPGEAEIIDSGEDENCDGISETSSPTDDDGDGYDSNEDCDDNNSDLNLDDADNDGYSTCDGDCDDNDDDINPGMTEVTDGIDNDCDGDVDGDDLFCMDLCSDDPDNMFGSNCGFENGNVSNWNITEQSFSDYDVVCNDGEATEGDCYLSVWFDRTGYETDCGDGVDNDSDGDVDGDDDECMYYMEQFAMNFTEAEMPEGEFCEFYVDVRVVGTTSFMYVFQVIQDDDPWANVSDWAYDTFTAWDYWDEEHVTWTVNAEEGDRRVSTMFGQIPNMVELQMDNFRLVCQ